MADQQVDVAIVGTGVSGVHCGWHLLQADSARKIVVFEGGSHIELGGVPLYQQGFWNVLMRVISNEAQSHASTPSPDPHPGPPPPEKHRGER